MMLERKTVSQCVSADYCKGWNDAVDAMPKWVSVEERLPEPKTAVLVYGQRHVFNGKRIEDFPMVHVAYNRGYDEGWFSWDSEDVIEVTHWMPMIKPPEDET